MLAFVFGPDWIWVLLAVVVLFGGSQLPRLAKNTGEAMKELRKAHDEASSTAASASSQPGAPGVPGPAPAAPPVVAPAAPVAPLVASRPAPAPVEPVTAGRGGDEVTLSRAELDAMLVTARDRAAKTGQQAQSDGDAGT